MLCFLAFIFALVCDLVIGGVGSNPPGWVWAIPDEVFGGGALTGVPVVRRLVV